MSSPPFRARKALLAALLASAMACAFAQASDGAPQVENSDLDAQLFYFTLTGAADRFFSARLVLRHCFDQDTLTEELRDRYRQHTIDIIMAGILAH